jgi:hypothetical protein
MYEDPIAAEQRWFHGQKHGNQKAQTTDTPETRQKRPLEVEKTN